MKIAVCSDLHLEFGTISLENTENAEVLILSGDILIAKDLLVVEDEHSERSARFHNFFQECSERFPHVVYIAGNHEHYHGDFSDTVRTLRDRLAYLPNLHVLDLDCFTHNDVTFIGGTLWTDMNKEDTITLHAMRGMMNDFRIVSNSNTNAGVFTPEDSVAEHIKMKQYIRAVIESKFNGKFVVVGHHAPSKLSTHPRYVNETIMNGAYSSDLSEFILDNPQIKLWTHGHTHEPFDYKIGDTRIVCNPRGYYRYENRANDFKLQFVEV